MSTLRELAAESIGRISRRGLEAQIAQIDDALPPRDVAIAVAPGKNDAAGIVVVVSADRLLISSGAPFTKPTLQAWPLAEIQSATAAPDGESWTLSIVHAGGAAHVAGMFDRDAQRLASLLTGETF